MEYFYVNQCLIDYATVLCGNGTLVAETVIDYQTNYYLLTIVILAPLDSETARVVAG